MPEHALTPDGGLVPWAAFTRHIGIAENLAADCPVRRTSPNAAPVYDVIQSFMLTALTEGRRFSPIERLRVDPAIPGLFGLASVVSDDTVRRFFCLDRSRVGRGVDCPTSAAVVAGVARADHFGLGLHGAHEVRPSGGSGGWL